MSYRRSTVFCALMLAAILPGRFALQAQVTEATILGNVLDSSGGAVANAKVEAKNTGTGLIRSLNSDAEGRYSINNLPIGDYEVTASAAGFQTVVHKGITLTVGSQSVVDFGLAVGTQQQTVTVEGQVSQVETTSSAVSSLVDQRQIRELPLNGRNIEQLILLAPGVQQITNMQTFAFWGKNNTYSVAGGRGEGQAFLLDNQDMQNFWGKGIGGVSLGTSLGVDAIAEFQTLTSTYSAQFGGAGAAVNSVSKSGTNQLHGLGFEYLRNSAMDARQFFDGSIVPPFARNQFGAALGGPIKKDKAFFFVNYEGLRQRLTTTSVANVPTLDNRTITATDPAVRQLIQQTLSLYPVPSKVTAPGFGTALLTGKAVGNENYLLARSDFTLSEKDSLFVRFLMDRADLLDPFSGSVFPYWDETSLTHNYFATIEERRIISPTLVNSVRLTFSRPASNGNMTKSVVGDQFYPFQGASFNPNSDRQDGIVSVTGLSNLGPDVVAPFKLNQKKYGFGDDLFWTKGAHSLKAGLAILYNQTDTWDSFAAGGWWIFTNFGTPNSGYQNFLSGIPLLVFGPVAQSVAPNQYFNRDTRSTEYSPYIHDEWKVRSNLTLNLGVRYTFQSNPTDRHNELYGFSNPPFFAPAGTPGAFVLPGLGLGVPHLSNVYTSANPSRFNFDPRIGFAYDPFSNHKTAIRGGFGLFHNVLEVRTYMPGTWNDAPQLFAQQFFPTYAFGQAFKNFSYAAPGDSYTINPGLDHTMSRTPYSVQWNMNVQHDFSGNILTVGYIGSSGVDLIDATDVNYPIAHSVTNGIPNFAGGVRPNPLAGALILAQARGHSSYNSLQTGLRRRLTRGLEGQVSYTWSHCLDNGSISTGLEANNNGGDHPQNSYDLAAEKSNCAFDVRQALRVNGLYTLPFHGNPIVTGWQVSGILTATSGYPFTVTTGSDSITGAQNPVRPNVVPGCNGGQQIIGTISQWFNTSCFSLPQPGVPGNSARTSLPGPGFTDLDVSLIKDTRVPKISEEFNVQFRAEFFNILNHPNFGLPSGTLNSPTAAAITTTVGNARQIQFGLRLMF